MRKKKRTDSNSMNYIITDTVAVANKDDIAAKASLLPDIYKDAHELRYGLEDYDPIDAKEIAEDFKEHYQIPMTESLVSQIINDALHMVNHDMEIFPEINIKDELPDDLKYAKLSWDMIINFLAKYQSEDELEESLNEQFGDKDCVIVPSIAQLYYTYTPIWYEVAGLEHPLSVVDVVDFRGVAEFVIRKLDEMGFCIVSDIFRPGVIRPIDIYRYAYLNTDLAMKVIHDNPIKLLQKMKKSDRQ
jgi:hypothetical protein